MLGNDNKQRLLLALAGDSWCAGELLAEALTESPGEPLSRMTINNYIKQLTAAGYAIERKHGAGYRLSQSLDLIDAEQLSAELGWPCAVSALTESTNDLARQWLQQQAQPSKDDAALFIAGFQTAGRGRLQRVWQAQPGEALLCSVAWSFSRYPPDLPALSLVVGLALVEAINDLLEAPADLGIKWPNDVLLGGKKLAGILIEASIQQEQVSVVIGMGLNNKSAPSEDLRYAATCLSEQGIELANADIAKAFVQRLQQMLPLFSESGFAPFYEAYRAHDVVIAQTVKLDELVATVQDIDPTGALLLLEGGQKKRYVSGELSLPWPCC